MNRAAVVVLIVAMLSGIMLASGTGAAHAVTFDLPGELIAWSEADAIIPRKSVFQVLDPETGLVFNVQRRAGSAHADVQPLSKADTAMMKQIYEGAWSWKRKAIIVLAGNRRLAASMHGMPHGGDGIPGNAFSGHFCIHFLGSTTHRSRAADPAHQWMVHKAAGELDRYVANLNPQEIVDSYIVALNQRDKSILQRLIAPDATSELAKEEQWLQDVVAARLVNEKKASKTKKQTKLPNPKTGTPGSLTDPDTSSLPGEVETLDHTLAIPIHVEKKGERPKRQSFVFTFVRASVKSPWKIVKVERPS